MLFGQDGIGMMLKALVPEEKVKEVFATFDEIKKGVGNVVAALDRIETAQGDAARIAETRHDELVEMLVSIGADRPAASTGLTVKGRTDNAG